MVPPGVTNSIRDIYSKNLISSSCFPFILSDNGRPVHRPAVLPLLLLRWRGNLADLQQCGQSIARKSWLLRNLLGLPVHRLDRWQSGLSINTHIHAYTHSYIDTHTYIHTYIHTHTHTQTHTHSYTHTHKHTHTHTVTHTLLAKHIGWYVCMYVCRRWKQEKRPS